MAGPNDLTGQNIQDTYKKVLQVSSSGQITDGTGSIPDSVGVEQIHFGNETDCKISGNGAVITIDGDNYTNVFADNQIKLHAPMTVIGSANASNFFQVDGEISASGFIKTDSSITASGAISSSGDSIFSRILIPQPSTGISLNLAGNGSLFIGTSLGNGATATPAFIGLADGGQTKVSMTSSGDIIASNIISSSKIHINDGDDGGELKLGNSTTVYQGSTNTIGLGQGAHVVIEGDTFIGGNITGSSLNLIGNGNITASGNISCSKTIYARAIEVEGDLTVNGSLTATEITSSIVSSSIIYSSGSNIFGDEAGSEDTHQFFGHITASGNISASGQIYGANRYLRNLSSLIWDSGDENQTVIGLAANHNLQIYSGSTKTVTIDASSGNISSSGTITASNFHVPGQGRISFDNTDTDDQFIKGLDHAIVIDGDDFVKLKADDHVVYIDNSNLNTIEMNPNNGNVTMSGVFSQSDIGHGENVFGGDLTVHGRFRSLGSQVDIMSGSVTASVGLLAPGFTASHKLLQLGSADDTKQELIVYGKIQQKGSDLTIMSGSITASANISTSATVQALTGSFGTNTTTITDRIETTGYISTTTGLQAPGFTASHKLLQLGSTDDTRQELIVYGKIQQKGSDLTIMSGSLTASADISTSAGVVALSGSFGTGTTTITDRIVTSGDIAATGNVVGAIVDANTGIRAPGFTASHKLLQLGSATDTRQELIIHGKLQVKGSDLTIMSGSISASGDISMSGGSTLTTETGSFNHIITDGNTIEFRNAGDGSKMGSLKFDTSNGLQVKDSNDNSGKTKLGILDVDDEFVVSGDKARFEAAVTASIISCSTEATMGAMSIRGIVNSFNDITSTKTITTQQKLQAPGFTASHKLLQLGSPTDTKQELIVHGIIRQKGSDLTIMSGSLTASSDISTSAGIVALSGSFGTGTTTITDRIQTSGDIQSSGQITGTVVNGTKGVFSDDMVVANRIQTNLEFRAPGFTASNRLLQLGAADNEKQELIVHGIIRQKGSELTMMSGSITASGDISSSATIAGLTGSFGTGTTTITDYIHTTGTVSGSGILTSGNIIAVGGLETGDVISAPEVEAGAGGVSSKGAITTQGLINAGTGLRAPGFTASHRLLQIGSALDTKQELIVHGKLQVKGSDFTIMSGSITASGDISASGNVMAGGGGTGSFDHIITSQNTIEFRNPGTRAAVGYVSFDATNGIQPLNASFSALPRLADKFSTARKIGGVSFDGSADIIPTGHLGSISSMKFVGADFNTIGRSASDNALATVTLTQNLFGSPIEAKPSGAGTFYLHKQLPKGLGPRGVVVYGGEGLTYRVLATVMPNSKYESAKNKIYFIDSASTGIKVGNAVSRQNILKGIQNAGISWDSDSFMITIAVTAVNAKASIYGGEILMA